MPLGLLSCAGGLLSDRGVERLPVVAATGALAQLLRAILFGLGIGLLFADRLEVVAEPADEERRNDAKCHHDVSR
ncbi:hypothetical protein D3C72_2381600 [compost metagenome]